MIKEILSLLLIAISGLAGVIITHYSSSELKQYNLQINCWRHIILGGTVFVLGYTSFTSPAVLVPFVVGLLIAYMVKAFMEYRYFFWIGLLLGSTFAFNTALGFLATSTMLVYNMLYSGWLNTPNILKRKSKSKERISEQVVLLAVSIASFFILTNLHVDYSQTGMFVALGALTALLLQDMKLKKK